MAESDLRQKAKQLAEFITPQPLRDYLKEEIGDVRSKRLFDPTIGSGQLLKDLEATYKLGCDIQDNKEFALKNGINEFIQADYITFDDSNLNYDIVVSNYPYSLKATEEQEEYLKKYYNKEKVNKILDEHFIMKSFNKASDGLGYYLCFPSILTRTQEKEWREYIINNNLIEKAIILENCKFEHTSIDILYLKLNKNKTDNKIKLGRKDFKDNSNNLLYETTTEEINKDDYSINIEANIKEEPLCIEDFEKIIFDYYLYEQGLTNNNFNKIDKDRLIIELLKNREEQQPTMKENNYELLKTIVDNTEVKLKQQIELSKLIKDDFIDVKKYIKKRLTDLMLEIDFL